MQYTNKYRRNYREKFGNDEIMNDLITQATTDEEAYEELCGIMLCAAEAFSQSHKQEIELNIHKSSDTEDYRQEMFIAFLKLDLNEVATKNNPKRYIIKSMQNSMRVLNQKESSLLSAFSKMSGKLIKQAMDYYNNGNEEGLTKRRKYVFDSIKNQNKNLIYFDEPQPEENVTNLEKYGGESKSAEESYFIRYGDEDNDELKIFDDPAVRIVMSETFFNSEDKLREKIKCGKDACLEKYGIDEELYKELLAEGKSILGKKIKK